MNIHIERLQRIIQSDSGLRSELDVQPVAIGNDVGLRIKDRLFANNVYVAEFREPWHILVSFPITPKLVDVHNDDLVEVYEYVLERAGRFGLNLPFKKEDKILGVGRLISCKPSGSTAEFGGSAHDIPNTLLESAFIDARESLLVFYRKEYQGIRVKLREKKLLHEN